MTLSRRGLLAAASAAPMMMAPAKAKPCDHQWFAFGWTGVEGRQDDIHYGCLKCDAEHILASNYYVGEPRREGEWSVPDYARAHNYRPSPKMMAALKKLRAVRALELAA